MCLVAVWIRSLGSRLEVERRRMLRRAEEGSKEGVQTTSPPTPNEPERLWWQEAKRGLLTNPNMPLTTTSRRRI